MRTRLIPALLLALVACNKEPDAPTFTQVRDDILVPSCGIAGCHAAGGDGTPTMDASMTAATLVGVESSGAAGEILVIAGDPDNSYIIKKLEASPDIVDDPMPPPFGGQPQEDIDMIRDWIMAGAEDN